MTRTLYNECESGNVEEAQQMILNGADVNMTNDKNNEDNDNNYSNDNRGRTPLYIASCNGHLEIVKVLIASGALLDKATKYALTPLYVASCLGKLEIVKVLIANKANFFYMNNRGETPLDVAKTNEIRQCIMNHPWYRRRPLLLTRPHDDHETNEEHDVTSLGDIITATKGDDPSCQDNVLFQIKIKIASFL